MSQGYRLKDERERLGFSQEDFAVLVGTTRKTQIHWEQDGSSITIEALDKWSKIGLDILYVITGTGKQESSKPSTSTTTSEIDVTLLNKIVKQLALLAKKAGRRWTYEELILQSTNIYNLLINKK